MTTKTVLFVCVHNAGRSQMAETFFNRLVMERGLDMRAESAGTEPGERVHPEVAAAMSEIGFDISTNRPQLLTDEMVSKAERVFTMGCAPDASTCPALFLKNVEDWALPDPHSQTLQRVREIRDEIRRMVEALVEQMGS
ncbi:MAG: arsenate reductase ArsC [Dehalococcoidia bacterium]|nr:arsenate reductase ArsC [Dehalococcoidia bacterium]